MDYAVNEKNAFIIRNPIKTKRGSDTIKNRREFFNSHEFSVSLDQNTNYPIVKITKKK